MSGLSLSSDSDFGAEVDVLEGVKELDALVHGALRLAGRHTVAEF
jgi:hypothetical protein